MRMHSSADRNGCISHDRSDYSTLGFPLMTTDYFVYPESMTIRLPDDMAKKLEYAAKVTERTKTFLIKEAIETYLEDHHDYRIALDRLLDKDDEIIESSDLRGKLGI